jgi:hypothetical protein
MVAPRHRNARATLPLLPALTPYGSVASQPGIPTTGLGNWGETSFVGPLAWSPLFIMELSRAE